MIFLVLKVFFIDILGLYAKKNGSVLLRMNIKIVLDMTFVIPST
jgi:hypothetical protein